jgi:tetratricopeptide (TPR) repeat protein
MLSYVVMEELAGRGDKLKAFSIALDALDRDDNFDPQTDPIVRVNFGRIRNILELYYSDIGKDDIIQIEIPKGTYRPEFKNFSADTTPAKYASKQNSKVTRIAFVTVIFAVLIGVTSFGFLHFIHSTQKLDTQKVQIENPNPNVITISISKGWSYEAKTEKEKKVDHIFQLLRVALSRNSAFLLVDENKSTSEAPDFSIVSDNYDTDNSDKIIIELLDNKILSLVWARAFDIDKKIYSVNDTVVEKLVRELSVQVFGAFKKALEDRDPNLLTAYQLFVMSTWVPGNATSSLSWEKERVRLARLALKKDPSYGPAHSVLADKLAYLSSVDGPSNTVMAINEAKSSALKAIELSPNDANSLFNVAQFYWHMGDVDASVHMMERVLEIDPNHTLANILIQFYPYSCTAASDSILKAVIEMDKSFETDNPVRWVIKTWISWLHLNRMEFELALEAEKRAAQIYNAPYAIIRHAVILNELEQPEKAAELIASRKQSWPNIDPAHFSRVTIPQLCNGSVGSEKILNLYEDLTDRLANNPIQ